MVASRVEVLVLGLVAEEPMHGYELLERIRARGIETWMDIAKASVYQALHRLEGRGDLRGAAEDGSGPERRVYRITRRGRERLRRAVIERMSDAADGVGSPVALAFVHVLGPDEARSALDAYERGLDERLAEIGARRRRLMRSDDGGSFAARAMLDRRALLLAAEHSWLRSVRDAADASAD
jgi:DNA-binding PadR family transcriptional regulator